MQSALIEHSLAAAGLAVLVLDESDRVIDTSPCAASLLGCDESSLIGELIANFLPLAPIKALIEDPASVRPPGVPLMISVLDGAGQVSP